MDHSKKKPSSRRNLGLSQNHGFALVVTISLSSLLILIVLTLVSLTTIETRAANQRAVSEAARANAKMALMIAIGNLQKEMGPDGRISFSASLLDTAPDTPEIDGVTHKNYLGVTEAWDTWLTDPKTLPDGSTLSIQDTYNEQGRSKKLFRRWLVSSSADAPWVNERDSALNDFPGQAVELVSQRTLGTSGSASDKVLVPLVKTNTKIPGGYAWWVKDNSQSITAAIGKAPTPNDNFQVAQNQAAYPNHSGMDHLDGLESMNLDPASLDKYHTFRNHELGLNTPDKLGQHYHHIAPLNRGLLVDVRSGRLKKDLSLLFEQENLPTNMVSSTVFNSVEFDTPIRPMIGELASIEPQNPFIAPVSWRQMHQYYRLYRPFGTDFTSGNEPEGIGQRLNWETATPYTKRFLMGHTNDFDNVKKLALDTDGYYRQPVLLRQTWVICTRTEEVADGYDCYIVGVPTFHLWNPYNVELRLDPGKFSLSCSLGNVTNLYYNVYKGTDAVATNRRLNLGDFFKGYVTTAFGEGNEIIFKPGEVIAFSTEDEVDGQAYNATFGYKPPEDTPATRGMQLRIDVLDSVEPTENPSFSLRFSNPNNQFTENRILGNQPQAISSFFWNGPGANRGIYDRDGELLTTNSNLGTVPFGSVSINWFSTAEVEHDPDNADSGAWLVKNSAAERAAWDFSSELPQPVAIVSVMTKGAETFSYTNTTPDYAQDFRNRTFLHASPANLCNVLLNPAPLSRANSPYKIHFRPVNGDTEVSQYVQVDGRNGYFGGGWGASTGQTQVPLFELPTSPPTSLAAFATMRMDSARARTRQHLQDDIPKPNFEAYGGEHNTYDYKHISHRGGSVGVGIGNSHAHPMIGPSSVYHRNNLGEDRGHPDGNTVATNINVFDDYWDQLFLTNEALWDSYYFSSLIPQTSTTTVIRDLKTVAEDFFTTDLAKFKPLLNHHLKPFISKSSDQIVNELAADDPDAWLKSARYLMLEAPFNVNTTSVEVWKSFLWGLRHRKIPYLDSRTGDKGIIDTKGEHVALSRFRLASGSSQDSGSPGNSTTWSGLRLLTESDIDTLAEDIVTQIKKRGPFLNMADFINHRLSDDAMGVSGTLQAAIDSDEFDNDYNGTGSSSSLNGAYKDAAAMVTSLPADYPNSRAAKGSRFAGMPGYLMQSDLLQAIGNQLTVRGDTFTIRAYGDTRDVNDNIISRAWCEAIVQRIPDYVDPQNSPLIPRKLDDGTENADLTDINNTFGRRFKIVSSRWLSADEI